MDEHELITGDNIITNQMGGSGGAGSMSNYNDYTVNESNQIVFEILNQGISDIIFKIKRKLGTDIANTNMNAQQIMIMLNKLQAMIDQNTQENSTNADQGNRISVTREDDDNRLFTLTRGEKYINEYAYDDNLKIYAKYHGFNIQTLDSNSDIKGEDIHMDENSATSNDIQKRLNNCHILEMLYLIKHEEVMKTFAFTLNLFDKYKYSIKLLLYVLKFLVVKKKPVDRHAAKDTLEVKLPKTLIPNIQTLLADQEKVQAVITGMQQQLEANPLGGVNAQNVPNLLNPKGEPNETALNTGLTNTETPQHSSGP